jgi:hypothetical protein
MEDFPDITWSPESRFGSNRLRPPPSPELSNASPIIHDDELRHANRVRLQELISNQFQLLKLRGQSLPLQAQVMRQQTQCATLRARAQNARAEFMKVLNRAMAQSTLVNCHDKLEELAEIVRGAEEDLSFHEQEAIDVVRKLSANDYRLREQEMKFYQKLEKLARIDIDPTIEMTSTGKSRSEDDSSSKSIISEDNNSEIPVSVDSGPLEALYSRIGDANAISDLIQEIRDDHVMEWEERDRMIRARRLPELSDAEFFEEYFQRLREPYNDLSKVKSDIQLLRQQCYEQGLTPEYYVEMSTYSEDSDAEDFEIEIPEPTAQDRFPAIYNESSGQQQSASGTQFLQPKKESTRDRINCWIFDVLKATKLNLLTRRVTDPSDAPDEKWAKLVVKFWSQDDGAKGQALSQSSSHVSNKVFPLFEGDDVSISSDKPKTSPSQVSRREAPRRRRSFPGFSSICFNSSDNLPRRSSYRPPAGTMIGSHHSVSGSLP